MPQLNPIQLDFGQAESELSDYKRFLQDHLTFSEKEVVAHLKKRCHLCCLIGSMIAGVPRANVYKFEFQIQGAFRADLVVGNSDRKRFVLVEFESGGKNSLFGPKQTNQMRDWSNEIGHGFGQLVDWGWAIDNEGNSQILKNNFGCD